MLHFRIEIAYLFQMVSAKQVSHRPVMHVDCLNVCVEHVNHGEEDSGRENVQNELFENFPVFFPHDCLQSLGFNLQSI